MKRTTLLTLVVLALAFPLLASEEGPSVGRRDAVEVVTPKLVGSWVATVTPDPASGNPPFRELLTFHSDGTMTMIDDNAPAPPFPFTPGHGVWRKNGNSNSYVFRYLNLMFDPASYASTGTTSITNSVTLSDDGNKLTASGHLKVYDIDRNLLFEADGTMTGERITFDEP